MILVSGATGLIGGHVLLLLTQYEQPVRAMYRSKSKVQKIQRLFESQSNPHFNSIEWVKADILDVPSLEEAFQNISRVYHCAGLVSFDPGDYRELRKMNIEGTANIVNFCIAYKVKKLAYISSIAVFGNHACEKTTDENAYWNPEAENNVYAIAKYGAEMEVWRATQEGIPVVIVNPGVVLGEGFPDSPSSALFKLVGKGLSHYPPGSTGFVDVKDVANIIYRLMESEIQNQRYILVGELLKYKTIITEIAKHLEVTPPRKTLKKWQLKLLWRLDVIRCMFTGQKRKLSRQSARSLWSDSLYSNDKIKKELNYEFQDIRTTLSRICDGITS